MLADTHTKGANYGCCLRNYHGHSNYPGNGCQDVENVDTDIPGKRKPAKSPSRVIVSRFIGILGLVCVCVCGGGEEGERGGERERERGGEGEKGRGGEGERGRGGEGRGGEGEREKEKNEGERGGGIIMV